MFLRKPQPVDITKATKQITSATTSAKKIWSKLRRATLYIGGLGCFTVAGWTIHAALGLVIAGASLFVLEMLTEDES